jgi:hypothetical protein
MTILEKFVADIGNIEKLKEIIDGWKYFKKISK